VSRERGPVWRGRGTHASFTRTGETPGGPDRHAWTVTSAATTAYRPALTPAFGAVAGGMETSEARADGDASEIAASGPDVTSIVDLNVQMDTYRALATVFRATDEMTATAVDLLA
jgi:hypothetical protein